MKKTTEYLIDKIIDIKIDLFKKEKENYSLKNDNEAHRIMIANLKLELTNLRLLLNNNKEE